MSNLNEFSVKTFLGKGFVVLLVRICGAFISFASIFYFARILEPSIYGLYVVAITIITIFSVVARWGGDMVILKNISINLEKSPSLACGYVYSLVLLLFLLGGGVGIALYFFKDFIALVVLKKPEAAELLGVLSMGILPMAFIYVVGESFKSYGHPVLASLLQTVIAPLLSLCFVFIFGFFSVITVMDIAWFYLLGLFIASASCVISWYYLVPMKKGIMVPLRKVFIAGWPMLMATSGGLIIAWSDIVVLGMYSSSYEVGIYSVASRVVLVTTLLLIATNSIVGPHIAKLYQLNDMKSLEILAKTSSGILFFLIIPPSFVLLFFPEWVMSFFGQEYIEGALLLVVLTIGQFINVSFGATTYFLTMTKFTHKLKVIMLASALVNIVLSILLVKPYGALGVAYATASTVIMWNIWVLFTVKKFLGFWAFNPLILVRKRRFMDESI